MSKHVLLVVPTYPVQRVIRTVLVDAVVWIPTLVVIVPAVLETAAELAQSGVIPASAYAQIAGVGAAGLALSGLLARIIALPRANAFLTRLGAGTVPRKVAREQAVLAVKDTRAALEVIRGSQP